MEVPVSAKDRRAADLVLIGPKEVMHLEIERHLVDFQAQLRAATLKRDALAVRFAQPVRLVLVIPDRKSSRQTVRQLAPLLDRTMPARSRHIRHSIKTGESIGADGILFWPIPPSRRIRARNQVG